jgi:hypothetical protein
MIILTSNTHKAPPQSRTVLRLSGHERKGLDWGLKSQDRLMKPKTAEEFALYYLSRGWSVIPIRKGDKRPALRWLEFQGRRADVTEVKRWFRKWPGANVGIVTGRISGLIVLDVDSQHGGEASLASLEKKRESMPWTMEATTGGGGRHLYFSHAGESIQNKVGFMPGLDLRADGGCVVAPPSLHPSGSPYVWRSLHEPDRTTPAPLPSWLSDEFVPEGSHPGHPVSYWRRLVKQGVREGERNTTIASLAGHLLWCGIDPEVALEMLLCWNRVRCTPPLSDEEVSRTVDSIGHLHRRRSQGAEDSDGPS